MYTRNDGAEAHRMNSFQKSGVLRGLSQIHKDIMIGAETI